MKKEIKCKKCGLTYSKKVFECPYCHKKRLNTTPIILLLVIGVIACIIISCGGNINNLINSKVKYIDGLKIEIIEYSENESFISNIMETSEVSIYLEITNTKNKEKSLDFNIVTYADDYKINSMWLWDETNINVNNLLPGKKCTQEMIVNPKKNWEKIELYYSDNSNEDNKDKNEFQKLFTIINKSNKE